MIKLALPCLALALGACSNGSSDRSQSASSGDQTSARAASVADERPGASASEASGTHEGPTSRTPAPLCVKLDEIEVEPMDLDALVDEALQTEMPEPVAKLVESAHAHGTVVPIDANERAIPLVRCQADACDVAVVRLDAAGQERGSRALPGTAEVGPTTTLRVQAALADVNSDGAAELWVGYQVGNVASEPSADHLAVFSMPSLILLWHAVVSKNSPVGTDPGCDGALYPVDVDCDGDGDLVLARRCAEARCLNDDSAACEAPDESVQVYLWEADEGEYSERPAAR